MLVVYVGRYRCRACSRSWCDDISQAAPPRAKLSFGALRWGLVCLIADNMSMNRIAAHLAVAWHTANEAILAYGDELLLADSTRFEGVRVIGVDEHVWRHRGGDRYATVIVDLTPVRDHTGPARLLDVVQGRSKYVLSSWLAVCPQEWKDNIEIVAMDGFSGYKSAAASQLPGAVTVMDPFHVVHIAIDALEQCRQRVQQETLGHRGRKGDPLYAARKTLLTGTDILTDTSQARLDALFACPDHADVHATWRIYQDLLAAYRDRDPRRGKNTLRQLIMARLLGFPAPGRANMAYLPYGESVQSRRGICRQDRRHPAWLPIEPRSARRHDRLCRTTKLDFRTDSAYLHGYGLGNQHAGIAGHESGTHIGRLRFVAAFRRNAADVRFRVHHALQTDHGSHGNHVA